MTYDEFKQAWLLALRGTRLRSFGMTPIRESLELRTLDRIGESTVLPDFQDTEPLLVTARLRWRWDALQTARTSTSEEDLLADLLGREGAARPRTQRPWLRVDLSLHASLPWGQPMPMPSRATWAGWTRDVIHSLEARTPLVPPEMARADRRGQQQILAWQGEPEARIVCSPDGELKLSSIEVAAWQSIDLARRWNDSLRRPDRGTDDQLARMFARLEAALHTWAELTIHLRDVN